MDNHVPVLYQEILDLLQPHPGGLFIDGTVGGGGHTSGLLEASNPDGKVLGIDRDPEAISFAADRLAKFGQRITLIHGSYADMDKLSPANGFDNVDGILLDLGLSSRQLADPERGFSFQTDGPLDMRFDPSVGYSAADLINELSEQDLVSLFRRFGEVKFSRKYARAIVKERPIQTTGRLAALIEDQTHHRGRIHPATQVFQALRIAVNDELKELSQGLNAAIPLLRTGGRLAVISFHSLEDRIVKRFIRDRSKDCECPPEQPICTCNVEPELKPVNKKIIRPSEEEIASNPRSRSARLRVTEKIGVDK